MPGFANIQQLVDAYERGQCRYSTWRKAPTQTTLQGIWFDLSMSPGNPVPNYYASSPNIAAQLSAADGGIYQGQPVAPGKKYVQRITTMTSTATSSPLFMTMCDYLLYYPFVDMGVTDYQTLDNTVTINRYTSGAGVKIMAVVVAGQTGGTRFNVTYTNQDGVAGRVTPNVTCNTQTAIGTLITTAPATNGVAGPFLPLQGTDTGVRKIEGVTFLTPDVGLITFVLVVPLFNTVIRESTAASYTNVAPGVAPVERSFPVDFLSVAQVMDNAYLNFICLPVGTLAAAQIHGDATFVWSN